MIELYWILAGTLALSGTMLGVYRSLWQICDYSNPYLFGNPENSTQLGILPTAVIQTGLFVFLSLALDFTLEPVLIHPFMEQDTLISIGITTGVGLLLSLQLTVIRHMSKNLRQLLFIGLSDTVIGAVAGGIFGGSLYILEGGIIGAIIGLIESLLRATNVLPGASDKKRADLFPFWIVAWLGGNIGFSAAIFTSVIVLFLALMVNYVVPLLVHFIGKCVSPLVSPVLILFRFKTILCNHCFRYTSPLRSRYSCGKRYCEHCQKQVEDTHEPGRLIVIFGDALPALEGRTFIFANPDFELPDHPIEVSEIYIDPITCDNRLLEKCMTSILHDPPKYGRRSVKVFYTGELDNLGGNLRNALQNNFGHIEEFHPGTQPGHESVFPFSVRGKPVEPQSSAPVPDRGELVEPQSPSSARGDSSSSSELKAIEPQSPFDRLRTNGERDPSTELRANGAEELLSRCIPQVSSFPSWRMVLKKLAGGITGGILGALLGGISFGLLAVIVAEMEGSIVLESQVHPGTIVLAWIAFATLIGIRKGIQKHQSFARGAIPLILIILLLAGIIIPNLLAAISSSKRSRTAADMRAMGTALGSYQVDRGFFPTSNGIKIPISDEKEDIGKRLCDEGYYCGSLQDSWQRPFIYISDGTFYTLTSYGKDKKPDGKGAFNSDIIYVDGQFVAPSTLVE